MSATTSSSTNRSGLLRLALATFGGALFFLLPVRWQGKWTVPFDIVVSTVTRELPTLVRYYSLALIVGALLLTVAAYGPPGRRYPFVAAFRSSWLMIVLRVIGAALAILIVTGTGPAALLDPGVGGLMFGTLVASVAVIVPIGALFITLFVAFGGLELVGTLARPVMRPLFRVPGRAALDAIASYVGSYSVGLYVTNKMYLESRYSAREAVVIATCFSTVSLGFFAVVASTLDLLPYFGLLVLVVSALTLVLAAILCRIPPLSRIPDDYVGTPVREPAVTGGLWRAALRAGRQRAVESGSVARESGRGLVDGLRLAMVVLPAILTVGVLAILVAEHTPVFQWLAAPVEPLIALLGIPDSATVAQSTVIGISEMFLPALLATGAALPAKFFVAALSLTQIFFFSATIPLLLSLELPVRLWHCLVLFVLRTLLSIPLLAALTHLLF
ncbi:nucleoside recognition GATE domain-containing membrane protein YjiH [Amycolatopsis arida]|uniref:Nucleoside recognition GATE domain-containing membrane protein YjiH n=1 Tax=Amycolatopsis arida TaxID=587909 RepID=A0A1I5ZTA6_9PSEU|nr:YjiH family protein [Amycolatopsis arida]TDX89340.1 nucleoside recognition membrane protein YjiH [Amycolatopsis arida]SFQ59427.1 nucleoside recognition GATE domain-containing membrane protein YjiH [Amycolatopsis arida]